MTFISYAQNYEDVTLWRALKRVEAGFYIDVGAWDPQSDSVTLAFSQRGWTGVNVEPVPAHHAEFVQRRPRDINLLAAAGAARSTTDFFEVSGTGLSTSDPAIAAKHAAAGRTVTNFPVEVITLADICLAHAPSVIHFLKLDCEGGERAVLAGCDFKRFRPWVVLVEAVDPFTRESNHDGWEDLLLAASYSFCWFDGLNRFYIAAEHYDALAPRLALPPNVFDSFAQAVQLPAFLAPPHADPFAATVPVHLPVEERIALAQRCRDCDGILKVPDAGSVQTEPDSTRVQIMHNGLKVLADGYCGEWMTRLITLCRGHHEPQEERLFHQTVRLMPPDAIMIELGGNWSYYSAWFLQGAPQRRAVVLEPDPANRAVGEQTMQLNGLRASFVAARASAVFAPSAPFQTERSGLLDLPSIPVPVLMQQHEIAHLNLLHCDVQGAELEVLEGCLDLFHAGRVSTVFVSTHVHHISGDPLTHQRCLALLRGCGAVIEAEHDPHESFSGDGMIVARFGPVPPGWEPLPLSFTRHSEAVFRDPAYDLANALTEAGTTDRLAAQVVTGVFDTLMFRGIDQAGLDHFRNAIRRNGDVAGFIRQILQSPEFVTKRSRFGVEYLHEGALAADRQLPAMPASGPFSCAALQLTLERDGPLGRAGELLCLPNDSIISRIVLAAGSWNLQQVEWLATRLHRQRRYTLLDLGANVGLVTRQLLRAFDNIDVCHCVEPDPSNYRLLCMNLADRTQGTIHTYPVALGPSERQQALFQDTGNAGNTSLHADAMRGRPFAQTTVQVVGAADWLAQHLSGEGPILWKSDIQGSDEAVVAATPWPIWQRVEVAIIELWRIRKPGPVSPAFLDRVADMPNRRLGGNPVSVAGVAAYAAGDDWEHDDLYLWR